MKIHHLFLLLLLAGLSLLITGCEPDPDPPVIESVTPTFAPAEALITIQGMNLANTRSLKFNGQVINFNTAYNSDVALLLRVPTFLELGEQLIELTTDGGTATANFRVALDPPFITFFSQESAQIGEELTIYGGNFYEPLEVYFFDSVQAQIVSSSPDSLVVVVPEGVQQGRVRVNANGGTSESPVNFFRVSNVLVSDFDGNGARADVTNWIFTSGLNENRFTAVQNSNPAPISGNFLKITGQDSQGIGFIGSASSPTFMADSLGITTTPQNTLFRMDVNSNGRTSTRLIIVLREANGSFSDFSQEIRLDRSGWRQVNLPLNRFQDANGVVVRPAKVNSVKFILFDSQGVGSLFEANIDNVRFAEIL